jgi:hypothetical protein
MTEYQRLKEQADRITQENAEHTAFALLNAIHNGGMVLRRRDGSDDDDVVHDFRVIAMDVLLRQGR